jgi:hypothetical protein
MEIPTVCLGDWVRRSSKDIGEQDLREMFEGLRLGG